MHVHNLVAGRWLFPQPAPISYHQSRHPNLVPLLHLPLALVPSVVFPLSLALSPVILLTRSPIEMTPTTASSLNDGQMA